MRRNLVPTRPSPRLPRPLAPRHDDGAGGSEKHLQAAFARSGCGAMTIPFVKQGPKSAQPSRQRSSRPGSGIRAIAPVRHRQFNNRQRTLAPSPCFRRLNRPFDFGSGTVTFNARSASGLVVTRAFGGVHAYKTTRWRGPRARRPLSSGEGTAVSFPCLAPFRSLPRPWPRPRSLQIKPTSR